jgi:hypothetical protein
MFRHRHRLRRFRKRPRLRNLLRNILNPKQRLKFHLHPLFNLPPRLRLS